MRGPELQLGASHSLWSHVYGTAGRTHDGGEFRLPVTGRRRQGRGAALSYLPCSLGLAVGQRTRLRVHRTVRIGVAAVWALIELSPKATGRTGLVSSVPGRRRSRDRPPRTRRRAADKAAGDPGHGGRHQDSYRPDAPRSGRHRFSTYPFRGVHGLLRERPSSPPLQASSPEPWLWSLPMPRYRN